MVSDEDPVTRDVVTSLLPPPMPDDTVGQILGVTPTTLSNDLSTDRNIENEPSPSGSFPLPTKHNHLWYKMCLNLSRVNPGPLALPTTDKHIHLPHPAQPTSTASSGSPNYTKGPIKELFPGSQPGEVFTQGQLLDTFIVGHSKTSTLSSLSLSKRHESHDHTLGGGGQLYLVFTLWILRNVIWKLLLEWKKILGRKRLLYGLWRRSPLPSLFFRVQIDVGSQSISRRGVSALAGVSTLVA